MSHTQSLVAASGSERRQTNEFRNTEKKSCKFKVDVAVVGRFDHCGHVAECLWGRGLSGVSRCKSANRDEGVNALVGCGASARVQIGKPGQQVEIDPQSYSTPDSLDAVKAWYKQNLSDWK